jgi:hypothetical protein
MQWSTPVSVPPSSSPISHSGGILLSGSCFTENIGTRLAADKFRTCINPYGILYNPFSIAESLTAVIANTQISESELVFHDGLWHSLSHHGAYSGADKTRVLQQMNDSISRAHHFLKAASHLIITWGSAMVYTYLLTGRIAGNCHKIPGKAFEKRLLSTEEITAQYADLLAQIKHFNPGLTVVLTISPVRHWRDGAENNQVSKATLLLSKHLLCESYARMHYFPAYEIVMDELRDYRFYAEDLLHPNDVAVRHIYALFGNAFFSEKTKQLNKSIGGIVQAAQHRPLHGVTDEYREFCKKMKQEAQALASQSGIDLDTEIAHFSAYL